MRKASTSSKESESSLADHPSLCTNAQNVCFTSFQDTDNEQLSTFAADSDCSDEREINPALVNEEAMCETCISSRSNSRSSSGEELNLGGNLSGNDISSSESDENFILSDSEGYCEVYSGTLSRRNLRRLEENLLEMFCN